MRRDPAQPLLPGLHVESSSTCPACGARGRCVGRRGNQDIFSCNTCELVWEILDANAPKKRDFPGQTVETGALKRDDVTHPAHERARRRRNVGPLGESVVRATGHAADTASLIRNDTCVPES